jgi:oligosaccharide repeat unit polymerase
VEREGQASSIFSLIGYLLGSSYFLSLAILFSRKLQLTDAKRLRLMLSGFLLLLANSVITGGRSGILLAVVFVSHAYFTKNGCNEKYLFRNTRYRVVLKVCALVAAVYSLYIFNSRANASDMNLADYSLSFLEYLGLNVSDWFVGYVSTSSLGEFLAVLNLAVSYLTHSLATMAAIVEFNGEREVVVFGHLTSILTKVGLASDVHESWFLAGRFASFPGGLYHQFGLFGMVLGAALLGIVGGLVTAWHNQHPNSFFILFMSSMVESVMLLSPFLFAGDFLSFPFLITGGLIVLSVIGISKAKRY